jgi:O-antigen/teichoic acid export membrane protein
MAAHPSLDYLLIVLPRPLAGACAVKVGRLWALPIWLDYMNDHEKRVGRRRGPEKAARMSIASLARSGAVAGVIKLASAGFSFLMFVVVAMITDERQFGLYSTAYAGASVVSFFATVGQQSTALRFWPQYAGANDLRSAHGLMARAIVVCLVGVTVAALFVVAVGFAPYVGERTPEWTPLCLAASLLAFVLAWSEFSSCAVRAKGALVWGLLPRDVLWRAAVIAAAVSIHFLGVRISAVSATLITAGLLFAAVLPQTIILLTQTLGAERGPLSAEQKREFKTVTLGLWGVTSLSPAFGQVSTLLVAGILGPEIAGAVFVADRTTRLVLLALTGLNQALAPEISAAFYAGDKRHLQRATGFTALGAASVALVILSIFWVYGTFILGIFQPSYATPAVHTVLMIFGIGAAVTAACGPVEILLQLTGLQHSLLKLLVTVNLIGLGATALVTWLFGPAGAALGTAATAVTWNAIGVVIASRSIGINPSILGLFADRFSGRVGLASRGAP